MRIHVDHPGQWHWSWAGTKAFLDGKEIKCVFYADTVEGVIKTYDVMHDGSVATTTDKGDGTFWSQKDFPGREVDCPVDGVLTETLRGVVTIEFPKEDYVQPAE